MSNVAVSSEVSIRNRFGRFTKALDRARDSALEQLGEIGEREAKRLAPKKTGRLKREITYFVFPGTRTVSVGTSTPYALHQEFGTRRHDITGRPDLSFYWKKAGRRFLPAQEFYNTPGMITVVNHPGNPARYFLRGGYQAMRSRVPTALRRAYSRA